MPPEKKVTLRAKAWKFRWPLVAVGAGLIAAANMPHTSAQPDQAPAPARAGAESTFTCSRNLSLIQDGGSLILSATVTGTLPPGATLEYSVDYRDRADIHNAKAPAGASSTSIPPGRVAYAEAGIAETNGHHTNCGTYTPK